MQPLVNTFKSTAVYLAGFGLLMLLSLLVNNTALLGGVISFEVPYQKQVSALLLGAGALCGLLTANRHIARNKAPWQVPQSQVSIAFIGFFFFMLAGIVLSH